MRRTVRFPIVVGAVVAVLLSAAATSAWAQGVSQVRAGSEVSVANNGECRPDTDVALYFEGDGIDQVQVGSAVSDGSGSFEATVAIPGDAAEGPAAILVDCGLDSAVLTYDLEVLGSGFSLSSLIGPALVGVAVVAIVGLVALLRRRRTDKADAGDDADAETHTDTDADGSPVEVGAAMAMAAAPAIVADATDGAPQSAMPEAGMPDITPPVPAPPAGPDPMVPITNDAPAEHEDGGIDDGADYWFWEAATSAGPRRRVACMTETTFHLHEVSVEEFQPMLDRLVEVGPDIALAQAFVRIPVPAIDRVVREGSVVHIEGRSASGPRRQTIDLADGADGVVEMLARRLPVVDARPTEGSVH